mmetsp:Transcript_21106/g.72990  ORF Transcript_21106/g.72990 Transcript_21106/m.72990 type:complete len:140 (-) Transcript_21106:497-916(-)
MEFAKCHLQLQHGAAQAGPGYRSSLHCLQSTFAQHGVTGLYKGATVWFVFSGPRSSIRFATFEVAKRNNLFYGSDFWCGMLARARAIRNTRTAITTTAATTVKTATLLCRRASPRASSARRRCSRSRSSCCTTRRRRWR